MKISLNKSEELNIFTVWVDDTPWRDLHTAIFGKRPGLPKQCESLKEWGLQFQELEYRAALQYAYKRLSIKPYLSEALSSSLQEKLVSPETATRVIEECQRQGFLNDSQWIESFIRRQLSHHYGPQTILAKLQSKGVSRTAAKEALSRLDGEEGQSERIHHLLQTRYRKHDLSDRRSRDKVIGALARKGFSLSVILCALKKDQKD